MYFTLRPIRAVYLINLTIAAFSLFGFWPGMLVVAASIDNQTD